MRKKQHLPIYTVQANSAEQQARKYVVYIKTHNQQKTQFTKIKNETPATTRVSNNSLN